MFRQYRQFEDKEFILCAVDTSSGGKDNTTAHFLSKTKIDIPLVYQSNVTTSDFIPKLSTILEKIYDKTNIKPVVAFERQNGGSFLMDRLAGINLSGKYDIFKMPNYGRTDPPEGVRLGWDTNTATRPKMLQELKEAIDKRVLIVYDKPTIEELFSFVVVQTSSAWKAQAENSAHDDLVMAMAIVWQMYQICENPIENSNWDDAEWEQMQEEEQKRIANR
jgi:hypothetical protein